MKLYPAVVMRTSAFQCCILSAPYKVVRSIVPWNLSIQCVTQLYGYAHLLCQVLKYFLILLIF